MSEALPSRPNLEWLRKTAQQQLKERRASALDLKLAEVQLELARHYGFSSWRALKAHVEAQQRAASAGRDDSLSDADVAAFLHAVGSGQMDAVRASLRASPQLVNAVGPHPYWGGRPQALHVSIETSRRDMFDILLDAGADVDGSNETYEHCSPLMLTVLWKQPQMQQQLVARGAKVGLVEALLFGDDARVARLLRRGRAALPRHAPNGGSILAMARTTFAIDRLLELGVARDTKDRWGTAPLEAMSRLGAQGLPLFRHLLAQGFEASPEEYARMGDRASLAKLLDAQPSLVKLDAVFVSAAAFGHHELVEWLLSKGANVNAGSAGNGGTALHSAAWEGDLRMAKILVAAGADLNARDKEHNGTPAGFARVAIEVTNNPACREVAEFLEALQRPTDSTPGGYA
jgi:ankyrin repeat protein